MAIPVRWLLLGASAFACLSPHPVLAAQGPRATVSAAPGTLVRWRASGTTRCSMKGRSWAALHGICYYPLDLMQKPALITIARWGTGPREFALPLGAPANPMQKGNSFGAKRVFDGKPASQPHNGVDDATPVGAPVLAVADGTVMVAKDMFFEGNAVFIDHGDGLISMYCHRAEIKVQAGQEVKKGHTLGLVGSTGRATGPHLFFGVRWHDARIDPQFLLEDPGKIPTVDRVSR